VGGREIVGLDVGLFVGGFVGNAAFAIGKIPAKITASNSIVCILSVYPYLIHNSRGIRCIRSAVVVI